MVVDPIARPASDCGVIQPTDQFVTDVGTERESVRYPHSRARFLGHDTHQ